jgi:hypothetical protein
MNNMMQWLDRFCFYETFAAKITSNGVTVKKYRVLKLQGPDRKTTGVDFK